MKSMGFPKMFKTKSSSSIIENKEATLNNIKLLIGSEQTTLFGDPFFGIKLKRRLFEQNSKVLKDIIIDDIYSQIKVFIPQVVVNRSDIEINQETKGKLVATIRGTYKFDYTQFTYSLVLFREGE